MCLGQCISNTELLDLCQLCEIDEIQYNMGPLIDVSKFHCQFLIVSTRAVFGSV